MAATTPTTKSIGSVGGWLPPNSNVMLDWVRKLVKRVDDARKTPYRGRPGDSSYPPEVKELQDLIESTVELRMLASAMFDEVPNKPPYNGDPKGTKTIHSYRQMLDTMSFIMVNIAPEWNQDGYDSGLIGFPFNAILDWPMATPSGYAFFLRANVNEKFKNILNTWKTNILVNEVSRDLVLTKEPNGWFCEQALEVLTRDSNPTRESDPIPFDVLFKCDKADPHYGFASWDDFFTRSFRNMDGDRPVEEKEDEYWVVTSCESKLFSMQRDVNELDSFWLKGQPYSVAEMVGPSVRQDTVDKFVRGTVYQAFLSATSYHRWHSPVKGKVVYAKVIDGTLFSEPPINGFYNPDDDPDHKPDPAGPDLSQGYITHVATRAVYFIDTEGPAGLVGAVYVGMADVSTCEIGRKFKGLEEQVAAIKGVAVEKGEEIGMFHHGGSTHCLLFEKDVKLSFVFEPFPEIANKNFPIRSKLAQVGK
ncbi:Phosphatidylserine decarboxylase proenzyme 3 [Daldinia childiae]|uniref:Phosphatidylserine decarboxylase proenzyme 3 n=1 Tax=Daldinia childiae TaxID=326645 RepID=UPI001444A170|nr:Phosphatidylserine decarboxylase proenzyme 3 [Daldinia childiae]KAF3066575.1 Phosphatidylserine decarboxylase proenzyme 3 [Daldinia childiae]